MVRLCLAYTLEPYMLIAPAFANAAASSTEQGFMQILPMVAVFAIFWFLMIRPQQKKAKELRSMLEADNVEILIQRAAIGQRLEKGTLKNNK